MKIKVVKEKKSFIVLLFAVLFFFGLFFTGDYGMPYDEKEEQSILNANIREYLIRFGMEDRIPEYTDKRDSEYRIATSVEKDHGIAAYYPIGRYILNRDSRPTKEVSAVWQGYTYCINFIGVIALYGICRRLFHKKVSAVAAALMFFFSPRIFAEMHYNNKDMVCLTLVLLVLYFGVRWLTEGKRRYAVLFGIASAYAINARLVSVFYFGLVGLFYLVLLLSDTFSKKNQPDGTRSVRKRWIDGIAAVLSCALIYVLITPAMWSDPIEFAVYLLKYTFNFSRWDFGILFDSHVYLPSAEQLPRMYLPVMIGLTTPIYVLVLSIFGTVYIWFKAIRSGLRDSHSTASWMISISGLFPVLLAVALHTHVYNGWRQFYFINSGLFFSAGTCLDMLFQKTEKKKKWKAVSLAAVCVCIFGTAAGILMNHPYEFAYMNAFAGKNAEERYELDYWHVASGPMIREVFDEMTKNGAVTATSFIDQDKHALYWARRLLTEEQKDLLTVTENDLNADYILVNLTYEYRYPEEILELLEKNYHPYTSAESYGRKLMKLYEKNT